jgi:CheY-like chemotaxis protein
LSRILVVDDESASRLVLKSRLAEQGYDVAIAESGARGLMEAREGSFDAILVSAALSAGLPGWEVCRRIKSAPSAGTVPVLLFSNSLVASDVMERAFEAGCSAFVVGNELPALEHQLKLAIKHRHSVLELADEARVLHEQLRRAQEERHRPHERDNGSHGDDHASALREIASGRPEGLMVVDAEGSVRQADRGASELLGLRTPGSHLGSLVPASGLEAFVRTRASRSARATASISCRAKVTRRVRSRRPSCRSSCTRVNTTTACVSCSCTTRRSASSRPRCCSSHLRCVPGTSSVRCAKRRAKRSGPTRCSDRARRSNRCAQA